MRNRLSGIRLAQLRRAARPLLVPLLALSVGACALPSLEHRVESQALPQAVVAQTRLAQEVTRRAAQHPGRSGIRSLADAQEAFAARVLLAGAAERTLDVQYYIWHDDITGMLLLDALRAAADRGVRVRLLVDDNGVDAALDPWFVALDAHESIEVRLFNPFRTRRPKALGYITDFSRANRRMHNKSFTADQQITIIGGRNIGDEYFGATDGQLFADLDVLAVGPVAAEVTDDFDRYWASASAYPVGGWLRADDTKTLATLAQYAATVVRTPPAARYLDALGRSEFIREMLQNDLSLEWAPTRMISDDPAKGLGKVNGEELLISHFAEVLGGAQQSVDLISSYFVPTSAGVAAFADMAARGIRVRVLTNALEATDVAIVHAGYAKHRRALLDAGVELFEMRRQSSTVRERHGGSGPLGSSGSSLHAKTFAVDGQRVFVGSFNFDPRSAHLNTELGFIIESTAMAQAVDAAFLDSIPRNAYQVTMGEDGQLVWIERDAEGVTRRHDREPGTTALRRGMLHVLSWLPIDWLL